MGLHLSGVYTFVLLSPNEKCQPRCRRRLHAEENSRRRISARLCTFDRIFRGGNQGESHAVRDALRKLEADGLVTIRAHVGASVRKLELREFREMCELRLALETHAAGVAAVNHTDMEMREIQFALEAMRRLRGQIRRGAPGAAVARRLGAGGCAF